MPLSEVPLSEVNPTACVRIGAHLFLLSVVPVEGEHVAEAYVVVHPAGLERVLTFDGLPLYEVRPDQADAARAMRAHLTRRLDGTVEEGVACDLTGYAVAGEWRLPGS